MLKSLLQHRGQVHYKPLPITLITAMRTLPPSFEGALKMFKELELAEGLKKQNAGEVAAV